MLVAQHGQSYQLHQLFQILQLTVQTMSALVDELLLSVCE